MDYRKYSEEVSKAHKKKEKEISSTIIILVIITIQSETNETGNGEQKRIIRSRGSYFTASQCIFLLIISQIFYLIELSDD